MTEYKGDERRQFTRCQIHEDKLNEMASDVKEIKKLLQGNGKIGLCGKVEVIWASMLLIGVTTLGLLVKSVWALI